MQPRFLVFFFPRPFFNHPLFHQHCKASSQVRRQLTTHFTDFAVDIEGQAMSVQPIPLADLGIGQKGLWTAVGPTVDLVDHGDLLTRFPKKIQKLWIRYRFFGFGKFTQRLQNIIIFRANPSPISHCAVTHMSCLATDLMPSPSFDAPKCERQRSARGIKIQRFHWQTGNGLFPSATSFGWCWSLIEQPEIQPVPSQAQAAMAQHSVLANHPPAVELQLQIVEGFITSRQQNQAATRHVQAM